MVYIWFVTLIVQNFKMPNPLKYYNHLKYQKMKIIPKFKINDRFMGLNYFFRYVLLWLELYHPQSRMFISYPPWLRMWPFLEQRSLQRWWVKTGGGDPTKGRESALWRLCGVSHKLGRADELRADNGKESRMRRWKQLLTRGSKCVHKETPWEVNTFILFHHWKYIF